LNEAVSFIDAAIPLIKEIREKEMGNIMNAASIIADSLAKGGILHLFGVSHSLNILQEVHQRKGGLIPTSIIFDPAQYQFLWTAYFEHQEGYAKPLVAQYDIREGEPLIVCSNSGINPLPVEVAIEAKKKGAKIIAITSMKDTMSHESRLSNGKKLYQVADVVIDNHAPENDLLIEIEGLQDKVVAPSGILGVAVAQEIVTQTIQVMQNKGHQPPVSISTYRKDARKYRMRIIEKYNDRAWKLTGHPLVNDGRRGG